MTSKENMKTLRENLEAGEACKNAVYRWHQIDGYCKECAVHHGETSASVQQRRQEQGYR